MLVEVLEACMKTIKLTMGQALVKFLNQQYISVDGKEERFVEGVFTIFGHGNVLGLGQALAQDAGSLHVYQGRNEQGMAHVATAFAKQNNCHRMIACTTSVGPGAANMLTAAATATANNIPLLLLPGDVYASRQPDPVLQQIEQTYDLSISTNDAFRSVCRYWDRITRPEQLMSAAKNAMRVLMDEANRGAVCLALPQDVQGEVYAYPISFFKKQVHKIRRVCCELETIEEAVALLKTKKRPAFICGGGVKYSLANACLQKLSERLCIPILETQAGKSAVSYDSPYNLGGVGVTGNASANAYAKQADCIIAVGTRLTDFTTGSKSLYEQEDVDFININASTFQAMKYDGRMLQGDAKTILEALDEHLQDFTFEQNKDDILRLKQQWNIEYERLATISYTSAFTPEVDGQNEHHIKEFYDLHKCAITQTQALAYINKHIADDAIVVGASGSLPGCMQRMWKNRVPNTYHMEYGYSCMGYEIAAGLGAKLASQNQEVYVMVGDGSYQMLHSELVTSLQLHKKINVLLFDNNGFGCINNLQMENGIQSFMTEFRSQDTQAYIPVDYAASAAGYGLKTYRVHTMEELETALEDSKKQSISTLIDIKVLPKTMTHGYDCWWNVGIAQLSNDEKIEAACKEKNRMFAKARKY